MSSYRFNSEDGQEGEQMPEVTKTERRLVCQSCGASFDCCASSPTGCWCLALSLPETTLKELQAAYSDCICKTCLLRAAAEVDH
jgi:hypothetical protein